MLLLFLACAPPAAKVVAPAQGQGLLQVGPTQTCASPVAGVLRLAEQGTARGFDPDRYLDSFDPLAPQAASNGHLVAADLDGDDDQDLVVGRPSVASLTYENLGDGRFVERTELINPGGDEPGATAVVSEPGWEIPSLFILMGKHLMRHRAESAWQYDRVDAIYSDLMEATPSFLTFALGDLDGDLDLDVVLPVMDQEGGGGAPARVVADDGDHYTLTHLLQSGDLPPQCQVAGLTDRDADGDVDIYLPADRGPPGSFWRNDGPDQAGALQFVDEAPRSALRWRWGRWGGSRPTSTGTARSTTVWGMLGRHVVS